MGMEIGGRSDKRGNEYENRYLVKLLLRMVDEDLSSIVIEPVGENSAEYIAETADGKRFYYQCKASNGVADHWRISDLKKYDVWKRAKEIILSDEANYYCFVSPVPYDDIDEICYRARTNSTLSEFFEKQINDKHHSALLTKIASALELDVEQEKDKNKLVYILSRCYFELVPNGRDAMLELESQVGLHFTGDQRAARVQLGQFANSAERYGVTFNPADVVMYMREKQFEVRSYRFDERIVPQVNKLNEIYWGTFPAINGTLIHRKATEQVLEKMDLGYSIVLHGRAGSGKSGCIQEVIEELKKSGTTYLAIKLNEIVPDSSADLFGKTLGLQESPVYALNGISGGKPCVLILDQLDALRWTAKHSSNALRVCKEMICQKRAINRCKGGKISILFASRTVDLETDAGIKELFLEEWNKDDPWEKIKVDYFTMSEVEKVVGKRFNSMSPRLKRILQTPSSLYVWTQLNDEDKSSDISSVFQLMQRWWEQVLAKCEESGLTRELSIEIKDKLVSFNERNNNAMVPSVLISDYMNVIEIFASCGIVLTIGKNVSFCHQSILDFFITQSILSKAFSGVNVAECISPYEHQMPQFRYRLLYVLQVLLEADNALYIGQSENLLCSDTVHYFYKCAVFEVAGQCEDPDEQMCAFINKYYSTSDWKDTVYQTVFLNHPRFVEYFLQTNVSEDETKLVLLRSISDRDPELVADYLSGTKVDSLADAQKMFCSLARDVSNDSGKMFQLRKELLCRFPELFNDFWQFPHLIQNDPGKAIELLVIVINASNSDRINRVYLGNEDEISTFVKENYREIFMSLYPVIRDQTCLLNLSWPFSKYSDKHKEYKEWFQEERVQDDSEHPIRTIVNITKASINKYAQEKPEEIIAIANEKNLSAVCHEIIVHGLLNVDKELSNHVISWYLNDFNNRMFVFTGDEKDYLKYTKQIISKFSSCCSDSLFKELESVICLWNEGTDAMLEKLKWRREVNSMHEYEPVYYAYWGHLQKELLPCLDLLRLSKYARELLNALNRNEWIQKPHFYCGVSGGEAKTVVSPIYNNTDRLSDAVWLQIIRTPNEKMKRHLWGKEDEAHYIEASHEMFSSSMRRQAAKQPQRFVKMSFDFPKGCYPGYICAVLDAVSYQGRAEEGVADDMLLNRLIGRFGESKNPNILMSISRVVEKCKTKWDASVITIICDIALNYAPEENAKYVVTDSNDSSHRSARSLIDNAINSVRGCAVMALSSLLRSQPNLVEQLKPVVAALCSDKNEIVRFASFDCLLPLFEYDPSFSVEHMKGLIRRDDRILCAPGFWEMMIQDYENDIPFYQEHLINACNSEVDDLSEKAASIVAAILIQRENGNEMHILENMDFSEEQANSIVQQAVFFFDNEAYHEKSEAVLKLMINKTKYELRGLLSLFYQKKIIAERDEELLRFIVCSEQKKYVLPEMLEFFNDVDGDLTGLCDLFTDIAKNLGDEYAVWKQQRMAESIIGCTLKLLDQGESNSHIREVCLMLWDALYKSNLQSMREITNKIEELNTI